MRRNNKGLKVYFTGKSFRPVDKTGEILSTKTLIKRIGYRPEIGDIFYVLFNENQKIITKITDIVKLDNILRDVQQIPARVISIENRNTYTTIELKTEVNGDVIDMRVKDKVELHKGDTVTLRRYTLSDGQGEFFCPILC